MVAKLMLTSSLLAALPLAARAQTADARPNSPQWFFEAVTREAPEPLESLDGQRYVQALAAAGREDLVAKLPSPREPAVECAAQGAGGAPIVEQLAALAQATRIVVVNEAPGTPRHRNLTRELARALAAQGYRYFAAEAFAPGFAARPRERFGRVDAGYRAAEPAFGDLIRAVKAAGYTLVAYEEAGAEPFAAPTSSASVAARARTQAENLVERVFAADPDAKVLIHVSQAHAAEVPFPAFGTLTPWLAAQLENLTGVDPLTIDQTYCRSESGAHELAIPSAPLPEGAFDIAVAQPEPRFFRGRPQWRIDAGAVAIELPETFTADNARTLIEARIADEPPDVIPVDRLLLRPGEHLALLLPVGRIRLTQYREGGGAPRTLVLNVR